MTIPRSGKRKLRQGRRLVAAGALIVFGAAAPVVLPAQNYAQRAAQARSAAAGTGAATSSAYGATAYRKPVASPARTPALGLATMAGAVAVQAAAYPSATNTFGGSPRPVAASSSLGGLRQALHAFYLDTGRMPTAAEGLNALLQAPAGVRNWRGPYISVVSSPGRPPFSDPWGNQYRLINTSRGSYMSFTIKSNGPDGIPETADDLSVSG